MSSRPGHTKTLNGYSVPNRRFTIIDLPGYGYRGREEWEAEVFELIQARRRSEAPSIASPIMISLRKAYLLLDSLHGPKEKDMQMLGDLAKTGISHQLVLTKLDRAAATLWAELGVTLRNNPDRGTQFRSASRAPLSDDVDVEKLAMGVWEPLRGQLGFACDETILAVSSEERWGLSALRCSILQACGALRRNSAEDDEYLRGLQEIPVVDDEGTIDERREEVEEDEESQEGRKLTVQERLRAKFNDTNPMRGKIFGGEKMLRQGIYRW